MLVTDGHKDTTTSIFVELFNEVHPEWEVNGDPSAPLTTDDIFYHSVDHSIGYAGTDGDDNISFHLDEEIWNDRDTEENLGYLIWLLGYFTDAPSHSTENWNGIVHIFETLHSKADTTRDAFSVDRIDWHAVKEMLIEIVEERRIHEKPPEHWETNGYERRLNLAEKLDYPSEQIDRFSGMNPDLRANDDLPMIDVTRSNLEYDDHAFDEVREWINIPYKHSDVSVTNKTIICCPIAVDRGDIYEVIDGDYRVDFQRYCERMDTITIQVVDKELLTHHSESLYPLLRYVSPDKWAEQSKAELLGRLSTGKGKTVTQCMTPTQDTP